MKFSMQVLERYTRLPAMDALVPLMEDVGLEVKRTENIGDQDVLTLELLANRGDHHCYAGVAREISGRTGEAICFPSLEKLEVGESPIRLENQTPLCLVYTATLLERESSESAFDADTLAPLVAADLQPVSAPVDATNLSNIELGQPTHAFDADTIVGGITIRTSRPGETAWPLFTEEHVDLPEGTLVIADDEKILAIAGVIGCEESKTTGATQRILLESACFDPVAVRKAGRALDIHTDARARFERGSDPSAPLVGAGRVCHLLAGAGFKRVGTTGMVGDWTDPERVIHLDLAHTNRFLQTQLSLDEVKDRLQRYGFVVDDDLVCRVPSHRLWDVFHWADLAEELAKSVGYNNTPVSLPPVDMGALPGPAELVKQTTDATLVSHGFHEVYTDGFYGRALRDLAGITEGHPLWSHVETLNSVDKGYGLLKNNAVVQAVGVVARNQKNRLASIKAFEWTRTFHPDESADNGVCSERSVLWGIAAGAAEDLGWAGRPRTIEPRTVKGLIEELGHALHLDLSLGEPPVDDPVATMLHPTRSATIVINGRPAGIMGEVHPTLCQAFKIKRLRPVYFELSRDALLEPGQGPTYQPPPLHQPIVRSLAFGLVGRVTAGSVADALLSVGPSYLHQAVVTDLFKTDDGVRAVTFELRFRNDGTVSADAVNGHLQTMADAICAKFSEQGVSLRA